MQLAPTIYVRDLSRAAREGTLSLERRGDGQLWAVKGNEARPVWLCRCFPWSEPTRFISLRGHGKGEFAFIREPADLDAHSRAVLESGLAEAGFVLEIDRIIRIEEEVEIWHWQVETRQGPRSFQTAHDEWPREVPGGGVLIRDVAGDLYLIRDVHALDAESRKLVWAFVD